jgi:hypothetical protein
MGTAIVGHHRPRPPGCPSMPPRRTRLGCARDPSHPAGQPAHSLLGMQGPTGRRGRGLAGRGLSPLVLSTAQLTAATGLLVLVTPVAGLQPVQLTPAVLAAISILGALGTGAAYVLNYRLITDEGPTATSTVTYLLPVVAIVLGIVFLGEPAAAHLLIGDRHRPGRHRPGAASLASTGVDALKHRRDVQLREPLRPLGGRFQPSRSHQQRGWQRGHKHHHPEEPRQEVTALTACNGGGHEAEYRGQGKR